MSMKHIIQDSCQERPQMQVSTGMKQTKSFKESNNTHTPTTNYSQDDLKTLPGTIQRLTQELQQARVEIIRLHSQTDKFQQQLLQQIQATVPFPSLNQHLSYRNLE